MKLRRSMPTGASAETTSGSRTERSSSDRTDMEHLPERSCHERGFRNRLLERRVATNLIAARKFLHERAAPVAVPLLPERRATELREASPISGGDGAAQSLNSDRTYTRPHPATDTERRRAGTRWRRHNCGAGLRKTGDVQLGNPCGSVSKTRAFPGIARLRPVPRAPGCPLVPRRTPTKTATRIELAYGLMKISRATGGTPRLLRVRAPPSFRTQSRIAAEVLEALLGEGVAGAAELLRKVLELR